MNHSDLGEFATMTDEEFDTFLERNGGNPDAIIDKLDRALQPSPVESRLAAASDADLIQYAKAVIKLELSFDVSARLVMELVARLEGRRHVNAVMDRIQGKPLPKRIEIGAELLHRDDVDSPDPFDPM